MFHTKFPLRIAAASLVATALAGCGSVVPAATPSIAPSVVLASPAVATAATVASAPAQTVVFCGTFVLENPGALGTYMLTSAAGTRLVVFRTVSSRGLPEFGTYACARFASGSARQVGGLSLTDFIAIVDPGEPGYVVKP